MRPGIQTTAPPTNEQVTGLVRDGFLLAPGLVDRGSLGAARVIASRVWRRAGCPSGWSSHRPDEDSARALRRALLGGATAALVDKLLSAPYTVTTQVAVTHGPKANPTAPHIDGPLDLDGTGLPSSFTLLVGVFLTDVDRPDSGNLWVWPGSHLRVLRYLADAGPGGLAQSEHFPEVDLGGCDPRQICALAGDVYAGLYLLGHAAGGSATPRRRSTVYFRLRCAGHAQRREELMLDPFGEFAHAVAHAALVGSEDGA